MSDATNPKNVRDTDTHTHTEAEAEAEAESKAEAATDQAETQELAPEDRPGEGEAAPERQVVYVHAPTPPKVIHNRLFGAFVALVGTVAFALAYLGVAAVYIAVTPGGAFQSRVTEFLGTSIYWIPILYFAVTFVGLALLLNRAGWAAFVVGSLVVALLVYGLSVGTLLLTQNIFVLTGDEAWALFLGFAGNAGVIIAALVAREIGIWFGLLISTRGRKVRVRNAEAKAAYDAEQAEKKAEYERAATTV